MNKYKLIVTTSGEEEIEYVTADFFHAKEGAIVFCTRTSNRAHENVACYPASSVIVKKQ